MEYKTYIQKPPTVEACYDEATKMYHVKSENGESDVPKELFENSWREVTAAEQKQLSDVGYVNGLS